MGIMDALKQRKADIKESCEYDIEECINNGIFRHDFYPLSETEVKVYQECLNEINNEMKGSGYHLRVEVGKTGLGIGVVVNVYVERDEATSNAAR